MRKYALMTEDEWRAQFLYDTLQKASREWPVDSEQFTILVDEMAKQKAKAEPKEIHPFGGWG